MIDLFFDLSDGVDDLMKDLCFDTVYARAGAMDRIDVSSYEFS